MPPIKPLLNRYTYWLWWGGVGLASLLFLTLIILFLTSGSEQTKAAFEDGRRLVISLETGDISGKIVTLDAPKPVEPPTQAATPEAPTPPPTPEPTPSTEQPTIEPPPAGTEPPAASEPPPSAEPSAGSGSAPAPAATPMSGARPELTESSEFGDLPVISADGLKPWRAYSKPFERTRNQPMVAIILSGLGPAREASEAALALPEYVTLSFSPYLRETASWQAAARASGHEILIDLPLEPVGYPAVDAGPYALLLDKGPTEAEKNLKWLMSRFPTSMGFLTPQNEAFTENDQALRLLIQSVGSRGLMLVVGQTPHKKETRDIMDTSQSALVIADLLIDEELSPSGIQARLAQLVDRAKQQGYALGIGRAYPVTVEQLRLWLAAMEEHGVMLVPASTIAKLRFS